MATKQFTSKEDFEQWLKKASQSEIRIAGLGGNDSGRPFGKPVEYFDYTKALKELKKRNIHGKSIYGLPEVWPNFNYKVGLDLILDKDMTGQWTFYAGEFWNSFDYKKALRVFKEKVDKGQWDKGWYEKVLEKWPIGIEDVEKETKRIQSTAKKMPMKRLKLKEDSMSINKLLNESGIRIPKGTHAAKIIFHSDLDGVFSAILTVNQLAKQGIPKDKIKLSSIQYGDNKDLVKKKLSASKGQMVALVDFARLPDEGERTPDFWSDHHQQDEKSKDVQQSKGTPKTKVISHTTKGVSKRVGKHGQGYTATSHKTKEKMVRMKPIGEVGEANIQGTEKGFTKELFDKYMAEPFKAAEKGKWSAISLDMENVRRNWKNPDIEYMKSKISASKMPAEIKEKLLNNLRPQFRKIIQHKKPLKEAIGKTDYPSETEHLATVHAQGLMNEKDIAAISRVDSANYTNLADVLDLPKDFRAKGRLERLAILTNAMIGPFLKGNQAGLHNLILNSSPSLVSVYNNLLKLRKLNNKQVEAIKEITKETPDWNKIDTLREKLPKEMAADVAKGKKIRKVGTVETARKSRQESIKKNTDIKTTKFKAGNDYVLVQTASGRGQPSRFMGSLLTKQTGERYPAQMREWTTMIQISLNPSMKPTDKEKFNLTTGIDKILKGVMSDVNSGKIQVSDKGLTKWALTKVIIPEAGGHAGIATVGGLGTLGLAPKNVREEIKKLQNYERRVKALSGRRRLADIAPISAKKLKELKAVKAEFVKEREMLIAEIKKRILDGVEKSMKAKGVEPIKGEERFKVKPRIKEDIQYRVKHWI